MVDGSEKDFRRSAATSFIVWLAAKITVFMNLRITHDNLPKSKQTKTSVLGMQGTDFKCRRIRILWVGGVEMNTYLNQSKLARSRVMLTVHAKLAPCNDERERVRP